MKLIIPVEFVDKKTELIEPYEHVLSLSSKGRDDFKRISSLALRMGEASGGRMMNKLKKCGF